jgi:very-short-patch-repair endonuclease
MRRREDKQKMGKNKFCSFCRIAITLEHVSMYYNYNKKYVSNAQTLRKNMTPEERHLWYDFLKRLPITVHRQKNIGDYIVDFCIASANLIIEIDGSQHNRLENAGADRRRDSDLTQLGFTVVRYTNQDIHERFNTVCADIMKRTNVRIEDLKPPK